MWKTPEIPYMLGVVTDDLGAVPEEVAKKETGILMEECKRWQIVVKNWVLRSICIILHMSFRETIGEHFTRRNSGICSEHTVAAGDRWERRISV